MGISTEGTGKADLGVVLPNTDCTLWHNPYPGAAMWQNECLLSTGSPWDPEWQESFRAGSVAHAAARGSVPRFRGEFHGKWRSRPRECVCTCTCLLFSPVGFFFLNNIGFCSRQVRNANMSGCPQHLIITVPIWKKEAATESKLHWNMWVCM